MRASALRPNGALDNACRPRYPWVPRRCGGNTAYTGMWGRFHARLSCRSRYPARDAGAALPLATAARLRWPLEWQPKAWYYGCCRRSLRRLRGRLSHPRQGCASLLHPPVHRIAAFQLPVRAHFDRHSVGGLPLPIDDAIEHPAISFGLGQIIDCQDRSDAGSCLIENLLERG
jgi:hypothetical protein